MGEEKNNKETEAEPIPEEQEAQEQPISASEKQLADYKETLQRLQADFENYRKRVEREKTDVKEITRIDIIKRLLPLLDSFEVALAQPNHGSESMETLKKEFAQYRKGVEMIYAQFHSMLKGEGLRPIEALNKRFNPELHDALMQGHSDKHEEDMVMEELQKGYMLGKHVIRHSKVKICKK